MHGDVSTRPERLPDDGDFLLSVYASTRPELTGLGWPAKQQDAFTRMQFDAQTRHYRQSFPDAIYSVISAGGEPAGRLIVNYAGDQILIIDIALLPEFRRTGIGSGLVRRLLDQADAGRLPVRCHVLYDSTARQFWEHAGFTAQGSDGVYAAMERAPQARPAHPDRGMLRDLPIPPRINRVRRTSGSTAPDSRRTARQFWEHAGFTAQGSDGVYAAMERAPQTRPP